NSFYVSAFAGTSLVASGSGSAATATGDSATAARCAANKPIGNSGASPTVATNKAPKEDSITGTASESIADVGSLPV
ncbi:MAG: hypothetical protein DMG56_28285, partial [Acidobacteria bacterium]